MTLTKEELESIVSMMENGELKPPNSLEEAIEIIGRIHDVSEATPKNGKNLLALVFPDNEDDDEEDDIQTTNMAALLYEKIIASDAEIFNYEGDGYIRFAFGERKVIRGLNSGLVKSYLVRLAYNELGKPAGSDTIGKVVSLLSANAIFEAPKVKLWLRVARPEPFEIWYDLVNDIGTAVKITKDGWQIEEAPVMFRTRSHMKEQVEPTKFDSLTAERMLNRLNRLFEIINCPKEYRKLFLVDLIVAFVPNIPRPIPVVYGSEGSAKTSFHKILREIIAPSIMSVLTLPKGSDQIVQMIDHHYFVPLDNLSGSKDNDALNMWLSDFLCKIVTGQSFSKRALYTNDDDKIYTFRRKVGINGINNVATNPDLLRRAILYELPDILDGAHKTEEELNNNMRNMLPDVLGTIFDVLSLSFTEYEKITRTGFGDMADFEKWGCAVANVLGIGEEAFMLEYNRNRGMRHLEALDNSLVGSMLISLLDMPETEGASELWNKGYIELGPSALLEHLSKRAESLGVKTNVREWPKSPISLGKKLKRLKQTLKKVGITIDKDRNTKGNLYTIKRKDADKPDTLDNFLTENNESMYSVYSEGDNESPTIHEKTQVEAESDGPCRDVGPVGLERKTTPSKTQTPVVKESSKKSPSRMQKFLLDRSSGSDFSVSANTWEKNSETIFKAMEQELIAESVDDEGKLWKGVYHLTEKGRELIKEWKR